MIYIGWAYHPLWFFKKLPSSTIVINEAASSMIWIPISRLLQWSYHRALDREGIKGHFITNIWVILVVVEVFPKMRKSKFPMFRWLEVTEVQFFHILVKRLFYYDHLQNRCTCMLSTGWFFILICYLRARVQLFILMLYNTILISESNNTHPP